VYLRACRRRRRRCGLLGQAARPDAGAAGPGAPSPARSAETVSAMASRLDFGERGLVLGRSAEGDPARAHPSLPAAGADKHPFAMRALDDERLAAIEPGDHARAVARLVSQWHVAPDDAPVCSVR